MAGFTAMHPTAATWFDSVALCAALLAAGLFKPWLALAHRPLQNPWCGAMLLMPWLWWSQHLMPGGMALHLSGACMLVLMFGWPLAMWSLLPVSVLAQLIETKGWPAMGPVIHDAVWLGAMPGTLALLLGQAVRRWLPAHLFVYILGRGFFVTALACIATASLAAWAGSKPDTLGTSEWLLAHWLLGWGEAVSTGMLTAVFVAFRPQWLLTYSDRLYLPGAKDSA